MTPSAPVPVVPLFLFWTPKVFRNPPHFASNFEFRLGNNVNPLMIINSPPIHPPRFHFAKCSRINYTPALVGGGCRERYGVSDRQIWTIDIRVTWTGARASRYRDLCKEVRPRTIKGMRDTTASSCRHEGHLLRISFGSHRNRSSKSSFKTSSRHHIHRQSQVWSC